MAKNHKTMERNNKTALDRWSKQPPRSLGAPWGPRGSSAALVTPKRCAWAARSLSIQQPEAAMRNNWVMTPFEMALFIGAATLLAGGFIMIATA